MAAAKQKGKGALQTIANCSDEEENTVFRVDFLKVADAQPQSKPVSFECGICYSKFVTATTNAGSSRGPVHGQFLSCKHGYCDTCMNKYVTTKLHDGTNPFPLHCPIPECQYEITEKHVQSLLTAKDYDLWKRKKEESNMNGKMYCPNKRCSKVLTISQLSRANDCLAECIHCHYAICTKCTCLWHNGYSCAQYKALPDARKNTEDSSVLAMAKDNKWCRCTKCQALVELRYGCNHITCHCGHQFCYKCGSSWNEITRLCSTGKCNLWDESTLLLAQNDREPQPAQARPVQVQPARAQPAQPAQRQPVRPQPVQARPAQRQPAQVQPAQPARAQPAQRQPVRPEPTQARPAQRQPAQVKPAQRQPVQARPAQVQQPQKQRPGTQKAREININFHNLLRIPEHRLPSWLYNSLHNSRCMYCNATLTNINQLKQHLETVKHHDVYYCCGRLFQTNNSLTRHRHFSKCQLKDDNHESEEEESEKKEDSDSEEEEESETEESEEEESEDDEELTVSDFTLCNLNIYRVMEKLNTARSSSMARSILERRCHYCNRRFKGLNELEYHYRNTAMHPVYYCCGRLFEDEDEMDEHRSRSLCLIRYFMIFEGIQEGVIQTRNLNIDLDEIMACTNEYKYTEFKACLKRNRCYYCNAVFNSRGQLEIHYEIATHDVFTCCGMIFKSKGGMLFHQSGGSC